MDTQHVYKHIHTFLEVDAIVSLTYKVPAKSTPVTENGRDSLTRKEGSGGAGGGQYGLPWNLQHITHLYNSFFTSCLPHTIQYLDLNSVNVAFTPPCMTLS